MYNLFFVYYYYILIYIVQCDEIWNSINGKYAIRVKAKTIIGQQRFIPNELCGWHYIYIESRLSWVTFIVLGEIIIILYNLYSDTYNQLSFRLSDKI